MGATPEDNSSTGRSLTLSSARSPRRFTRRFRGGADGDGQWYYRTASDVSDFNANLFDPAWLRDNGRIERELASGRGTVYFFTHNNRQLVLKKYHRGGLPAKISSSRYVWLGEGRSRSCIEFELLDELHHQHFPVPKPYACATCKSGLSYKALLITEQVIHARSLIERLLKGDLKKEDWHKVGTVLAQFHKAAVSHADLNASNILFDGAGEIVLIDFDNGVSGSKTDLALNQRSLDRLLRSLKKAAVNKIAPSEIAPSEIIRTSRFDANGVSQASAAESANNKLTAVPLSLEQGWQAFLEAYEGK